MSASSLPAELSYIHPAVVSAGMALALWALRHGLALRDLRVHRRPPEGSWRRHLVWSQPAVLLLLVGFGLGPLSAVLVRDWPLLRTAHGWVGLAAVACFGAGSLLGWRRKRGRSRRVALHGALGVAGVLLGAVAALTGLELLP